MNFTHKLYCQYNIFSKNKIEQKEKTELFKKYFDLPVKVPLFCIGILNDFLAEEPQHYFDKNAEKEVFNNFSQLYKKDKSKFLESFSKEQDKLFNTINSYYSVLDTYKEFDDVNFNYETKIKVYYIPIITQLMEFCLSHIFKLILYVNNEFIDGKDYKNQKTLGAIKNILDKFGFNDLIKININFRNAISHGLIDISENKIIFSYTKVSKKGNKEVSEEIKFYQLEDMKNTLLDIVGGSIVGLIRFIILNNITNYLLSEHSNEKLKNEYIKLFLHNENIKVKFFSKAKLNNEQLNIQIDIKNIKTKDEILKVLIWISKIIFTFYPNYNRYFINYNHPLSIDGFLVLEKEILEKILLEDSILNIDKIISKDSEKLIFDIQSENTDIRSYKFFTFPKIYAKDWEVIHLEDISIEKIKRYKCNLLIDMSEISKDFIVKLLFQVVKKVRVLENKKNPITKIKYGKIEADVVTISVFYKIRKRINYSSLASNKYFICKVDYYKNKSTPKIRVPLQNNYIFENIKKFDIYWNKNFNNI